jgi:hypothetical protein
VNAPGPLREAFLAFVGENAADLAARAASIPAELRPRSARVPPSAAAPTLDLTGLDPMMKAAYPDLGHAIATMGCPTCHTEDAEFVQTSVQRTFSPFYDRELDARAERIDRMNAGDDVPVPPFGPLQ